MLDKLKKWWPEIMALAATIWTTYGTQITSLVQQVVLTHPKLSMRRRLRFSRCSPT